MLVQLVDRGREDRDLDVGRTGVGSRPAILGRQFGFLIFCDWQDEGSSFKDRLASGTGSVLTLVRPGDRGIIPSRARRRNPGFRGAVSKALAPMDLAKKTFLITGGASGLGAACVREFTAGGANVVICDVNEHGAEVAKEAGANARFHRTDVTTEKDVRSAVGLALKEFGALHGAINCAGIATAERVGGR